MEDADQPGRPAGQPVGGGAALRRGRRQHPRDAGVPRHRVGHRRAGRSSRPTAGAEDDLRALAERCRGRRSSTPTAPRRACCSTRRPATSRRRAPSSGDPAPVPRGRRPAASTPRPTPVEGRPADDSWTSPSGTSWSRSTAPRPSPPPSTPAARRMAGLVTDVLRARRVVRRPASRPTRRAAALAGAASPTASSSRRVVEVGRRSAAPCWPSRPSTRRPPPGARRRPCLAAPRARHPAARARRARLSAALGDDEMSLVTTADNPVGPAHGARGRVCGVGSRSPVPTLHVRVPVRDFMPVRAVRRSAAPPRMAPWRSPRSSPPWASPTTTCCCCRGSRTSRPATSTPPRG